eukprot:CAMPEP_0198223018 /NCGR_PEP_ID=MMETSP1445-20131203/90636_1 /TAXON_ID=36898 /ORGANISM="Pyramimonas sp., Strain CCMP2087" /LENGTH=56 /DNA_ID=CAMNT_0043901723 /DNA_START=87 /DNA_END=254 /DNA_ORIENTATION=-
MSPTTVRKKETSSSVNVPNFGSRTGVAPKERVNNAWWWVRAVPDRAERSARNIAQY